MVASNVMWNQSGSRRPKAAAAKKSQLEILPITVSQLLSASQTSSDGFAICGWDLNQVSVVGVVRGLAPFVTNIQYSVDDMTGPPLTVKLWVNMEDCSLNFFSPGTYVKVIGSLRNFAGQRSLLAMDIRRIEDLNEITSHMLEVVQAHLLLFGKVFDVNMNTTAVLAPGRSSAVRPEGGAPNDLSTIQSQVFQMIQRFSVREEGISFHDLKTELHYLSMKDIRTSLAFLINEGHIFSTIDEHHFKSAEH